MKTKILKINPENPDIHLIKEAAEILKAGGLCVFPTETVYGLGANGLSSECVKRIFEAKGRPADNPLILHISNNKMIKQIANQISEKSEILIEKFMPGPLALVLNKKDIVPSEVSAGLNTVAVRMPANKIALALIEECGFPIAAPSANISGKPSPTDAEHAIEDLFGKVDCIIDGGPTNIGIESTVLDMTYAVPQLLRPGNVTINMIENEIGIIEIPSNFSEIRSPGMKYKHYAPKAKVIIAKNYDELIELAQKFHDENVKFSLVCDRPTQNFDCTFLYKSNEHLAANLFSIFRTSDKNKVEVIIVKAVHEDGLGLAIMNRLKKAAVN